MCLLIYFDLFVKKSQINFDNFNNHVAMEISRASSTTTLVPSRPITPGGQDFIGNPPINTEARDFRFSSKCYFLTWSQVGERPNSLLEDKMAEFGSRLTSE
jgi:hypothetical protein